MSDPAARITELLDQAATARAAGDFGAAREAGFAAFSVAQLADRADGMAEAALELAQGHRFGTHPGRIPAFLHEAYTRADGTTRIRLAVALARTWAYGNDPGRAVPFAEEAVAAAERLSDPELLVDALDAQLLVSWGPDQFDERARITIRLESAAAHVMDVEARMSAHLWRVTTALEALDPVPVARQLRALDGLAEESGAARVRFFAAARRGMHSLLIGDIPIARECLAAAEQAGIEAGEPDTEAIVHTLRAWIARQLDDRPTLAAEAAIFEAFGLAEGIPSVAAESAVLWLAAGENARARDLLEQLAGAEFAEIPRDVDWLYTLTMLTEVAAGTGAVRLVERGVTMLEPYAGRGVMNGGAVAFAGVVDDFLRIGCAALGRDQEAHEWAGTAAAAYHRLNATWWLKRIEQGSPSDSRGPRAASVVHLYPSGAGIWTVGAEGATRPVRDMKGLHYLRLLLGRPGVDISALDLSSEIAGHAGVAEAGLGELVDRQALAAYRRRLADLDAELDEAAAWADEGRRARAQLERDALVDHLAGAAGLSGRQRLIGGSAERARVAVRKAIAGAVDRLEGDDRALARLLRDSVRTGTTCRYEPDPGRPVRWLLEAPPATGSATPR
jgi:hypothetical protein